MPFFLDPTFLLLIPPMLLAAYATAKVKSTFAEYSRRRALAALTDSGFVSAAERQHVKKVLDAAALTYMAAAFMAVMMLLRFIMLLSMVSRRD